MSRLEVRSSPKHGRGVFAAVPIAAGCSIEVCPVLLLPEAGPAATDDLYGYLYSWDDGLVALALGFGSLYNHDPDPAADYYADHEAEAIELVARRDILAGEEITIDYTGGGTAELWFDPTG